ncbi:hypothetical protein EC988_005326 [Linderina pennispora]|nr:hypothetical protein EC988_005326 [Linderina pennispora]
MSKEANGKVGGDIPKIQLETKEDVLFLQGQFSEFLQRTMSGNAALRDGPYTDAQREEARTLVLTTLQEWSEKVWKVAGDNISVNGFPYREAMAERARIEPLDEKLKSEVEALREEANSLLLSVTQKRQTVPEQIESLVNDVVCRESIAAENTTELQDSEERSDELPYVADRINGEFQQALQVAKKLGENVPKTIEELQRLSTAVEDTRARLEEEKTGDEKARWVLYGRERDRRAANNGVERADAQALAYRAALHAVSNE